MTKKTLDYKQIFRLLFLSVMIALPEVIAFAPNKVGVALITIFLVIFSINIIFTLKSSFKIIRNNKNSILEDQAINKDLKNAAAMMIIAGLMVCFVLIKFIYSASMSEWWIAWYTKQAMIIWWVSIESTAMVVLAFLLFVISRKTLSKMMKNIKKLIFESFLLFKKVITAMISFWKIVFEFVKNVLQKYELSVLQINSKYHEDSDIEATIFKDQFLATTKKATWPPLF